jgi:hypothetical protein
MERLLTNIIKGVMYSLVVGILGAVVALLVKWPVLKGVYVMVLGLGVVSLALAVLFFIGTPKMRYEYFTGMKYKRGAAEHDAMHPERIPKEQRQSLGNQAGDPAIIGIVMIVIGFFIEALMH